MVFFFYLGNFFSKFIFIWKFKKLNKKIFQFFFTFGCYCPINAAQLPNDFTFPTLGRTSFFLQQNQNKANELTPRVKPSWSRIKNNFFSKIPWNQHYLMTMQLDYAKLMILMLLNSSTILRVDFFHILYVSLVAFPPL